MKDILRKKIDSLPPLPETIIELEKYKRSSNKDPEQLLKIIEKDPLIISTLLKVANSAMFGFSSKVETVSRALGLLGSNFTLSIAFGSAIQASLSTDLKAYGMNANDFMRVSNLISNLINLWLARVDFELKEALLLPSFLQETGQFIISDLAQELKKDEDFYKDIQAKHDIAQTEKEFFDITTSEITASIFRHWGLDEKMINMIEYVDILDKCPDKYKREASILHIAKTICNPLDPLSDKYIAEGLDKAEKLGFDIAPLQKAIEKMQDRLLDEKE